MALLGSSKNREQTVAKTIPPAIVIKITEGDTSEKIVKNNTAPILPYAPTIPAIWPVDGV